MMTFWLRDMCAIGSNSPKVEDVHHGAAWLMSPASTSTSLA